MIKLCMILTKIANSITLKELVMELNPGKIRNFTINTTVKLLTAQKKKKIYTPPKC